MRALLGLLPPGLESSGQVRIDGHRVDDDPRTLRKLRGGTVSLLMQDPFTLLNPLRKAGRQIADGLPAGADPKSEVARLLAEVGLGAEVAGRYPFQLSGGMRQRVGLAAALAAGPRVLVADEPTTALDTTTQREVLALIRRVQRERDMTFLLITHDLRVAFSMCDRVVVMYAGRVMEVGRAAELGHPYRVAGRRAARRPAPGGAALGARVGAGARRGGGALRVRRPVRPRRRSMPGGHPRTPPPDVDALLELVGLDPALAAMRPANLSGGERQRVAIARAVAGEPRLLVCDEPVSALDVSVQAQVLTLLAGLRERLSMGLLFITHDLAVVRQLADRMYVLRAGECVESGLVAHVLDEPGHPYTRELLASVPDGSGAWP